MDIDESTPDDTPAMTPPSEIDDAPPEPSKWPTVIGAISIVFGSLGLVCYGCMSLNTIATPMLVGMVPEDQRPPTPQGLQLFVQIFQMCAAFGLSVWLLIAGIGLARRRSWSRAHSIGWSVGKILLTVISTAAAVAFVGDTVDQINGQMSQGGKTPPFTFSVGMFLALFAVSAVWAMLWPAFLLIWFSRGAVKDEVAAWEAESRAMI
jgi:hypothetical protein